MDPLSITASLIAVLQISGTVITALYGYRTSVKSASSDAARIISELNGLRGVLESLLQAIEKENSRVAPGGGESRLATLQTLAQPSGDLELCKADLEAASMKLGCYAAPDSVSDWKKVKRALEWPFKEKDVTKLLMSMQRAKSTMHLALSVDQTALTLKIREGLGSLTQQFAADVLDRRKRRLREWVAAPDPFPNHAAAKKKRQPLTGDWFLSSELYAAWRSSPRSFLWLHGIPGAGKSVLCSSIIEDLLSCQPDDSLTVTFYYFDFNDTGKRDTTSLIRALVVQLLAKIPSTAHYLQDLPSHIYEKPPDTKSLLDMLRTFVQEVDQTFLVIDGLDECEECEELMALIRLMYGWGLDQLHILISSRELPEIKEAIADCAISSLCLQNSINQDISILIQERLSSDRKFQKWPYHVRKEIEEALTDGASGMFRWVSCQLDILRNCVTLAALRKALKSLPKTLNETYERILANIDDSYICDVQKILQFLTFSPCPMSLPELVEVLAVDLDGKEPQFNLDNRIPDPKDIISMCSALVTTAYITDYYLPDATERTVEVLKLAHFSVKEYLLSECARSSKAFMYSMDTTTGNLLIAKTYLAYLLGPQFAEGHCGLDHLESRCRSWPLFEAAVLLWSVHIANVDDHVDTTTKEYIQKLFSTRHNIMGGNYTAWVGGLIPEADTLTIINTPPLYYAASFGMTSIVKLILSDIPRSDIDIKGGRAIATPLHVACFRGKQKVVELLLKAGADPNTTNTRGESCLYWARRNGSIENQEIYNLLLEYGAKNQQFKPSYSPRFDRKYEEFDDNIQHNPINTNL